MTGLALALLLGSAASPAEPDVAPAPEDASPPQDAGPTEAVEPKARRVPPRWRGRLLPPEADFYRGDVDLKLRLAFNGTSPNPFTLLTSLAGWNELSITVDAGVASWRDFTIGVGVDVHHGESLILGVVNGPIADYDDFRFAWRSSETGGAVRVTAHTTALRSVDPYLVVAVGAAAFRVEASLEGAGLAPADHLSPYLRFEAGGGLTWRLGTKGWILGLELRYLLTADLDPVPRFVFEDGDDLAVFALSDPHRPPKGFSWVVHAGYRF